LQRAVANRQNLVITHEPTFYNHLDQPQGMDENDAVWKEKRAFIEKNGLVVWRFHDHWHLRKPDGILAGMVKALDWEKYQGAENPHLFTVPETTLEKLAADVAKRLNTPVLRAVGNPEMKVTRLALSPGSAGFERETHALEMDNVEVLLVGETREWETVEYAADAVKEGKRKALMVIWQAGIVLRPPKVRSRALRLFRCRTEEPPHPLEKYHSGKGRCVLSALLLGLMGSG